MRRKHPYIFPMNLDSLVDIVSNNIGVLIILAVFMSLFMLNPPSSTSEKSSETETGTVQKIRIPWAHYTQKSPLLFAIQSNQLIRLDRSLLYEQLRTMSSSSQQLPTEFETDHYRAVLTGTECLQLFPKGPGTWWHDAKASGPVADILDKANPSHTYLFFWVQQDSFELFRSIREELWDARFEVGWSPVRDFEEGVTFCQNVRGLQFQPQ